eukprot:XP_003725040.2 PREDICTED: sushi, von Willebrand factor type A, EGF and pentraxin domain-containing protein 1 [Strongylocentrotus purpuratus]
MGTTSLQCELTSDGTPAWNDVTPTCLIQTCPSLQIPEFASLSGCDSSPVPFGSICTFSCELGYTGIGESIKSCLEEEVWSSTSFVCERLPCEVLSEPSSIMILPETCLSDPRFGDVCSLECEQSGFKITPPGLKEVTCSSDETWTGEVEQAQCVDLELPVFEDCPSDIVAFASKNSDKANVEWSAIATDNDPSQEPVVTCNPQPGILTIGVHVVRCSALDEAGNEATCQFTVEVKARQCQPLTPPAHGIVMDTCDTTYGSTCHIECSEGYLLVGSSIGNCEFDGTNMFWQFENEPLCITTSCNPLDVPDPILFSPASCSGSGMVHDGTVCTLSCDFHLTLETEVELFTCLKGEWSQQPYVSSIQCIDEVPPTLTYCPPHILTTRTEYWGVEESFVYPSAEDNFDMELQVTADPLDLMSPYTFTSDTTCTYTFTDDAGNSVSCVFQIDITNDVQPVITSCPTGGEVNTSDTVGLVHYEKPSYLPMPGIDLLVSCNVPDSPIMLPVGDHDIICHVSDPASGLQAECRMSFRVMHESCLPLNSPMNGALACDIFADGRYCSVLCEDGYDVPRVLTGAGIAISLDVFICGTSGSWHPQQSVPDCSEPKSSKPNLPLKIMYYPSSCSEADASSIDTISSQFLEILEQSDFDSICDVNSQCSVDNVEVSCGVKNERRRRSIPDQRRPKLGRGSGGPTSVSMVLRLTDTMKLGQSKQPEGQHPHQVLHNLAHHIHSHVQHHFSKADGDKKEDGIPGDAEHQRLKPDTTLLFGDVLAECDEGYYLDEDGFKCIPCPAGYYLDVASEICTPCNQGFFQDDQAQTECKPCRDGTSTIDQGATRADQCKEPCPAGHLSKSGFHPCTRCPPGLYQPHPQRTSCTRCPGNTTTAMYGATSINSCHIVN